MRDIGSFQFPIDLPVRYEMDPQAAGRGRTLAIGVCSPAVRSA